MSKNDDKDVLGDVSPEELAQAEALGGRVDELLAGKGLPVLAEAEERELAQMSAMVHAANHPASLPADRKASLIEAALAQATGASEAAFDESPASSDLDRARARRKSAVAAGVLSLVAAAAVMLLLLKNKGADTSKPGETPIAQVPMSLPQQQQSRPADDLVGQIQRAESGEASKRVRAIYDDRMAGYRALRYRRITGDQ